MVEVYGLVPECGGARPSPTRKKPGSDWLYHQMVKQRDEHGQFVGTKLRVIFVAKAVMIALMGKKYCLN
jgi:hypothetical protein